MLEMYDDASVVHDAVEDSGGLTVHEFDPEHWDIVPNPDFGGAPCPHGVAEAIRGSGATAEDVLDWMHVVMMDLADAGPEVEEELSFTADIAELPDEEAYAVSSFAPTLS